MPSKGGHVPKGRGMALMHGRRARNDERQKREGTLLVMLPAVLLFGVAIAHSRRAARGVATGEPPVGYSLELERVSLEEVAPRLKGMQHYLDYTGAAIAPSSMLDEMNKAMKERVHANPHSFGGTKEVIERVRQRVLSWLGTREGDYHIVFTSGATGALKMVGEAFPWREGSWFMYLRESHNSVLGVREYALKAGGYFRAACEGAISAWLNGTLSDTDFLGNSASGEAPHLLAFPGEENFSGTKYPLRWVEEANRRGWRVLVDAAALCQSERLDLARHRPDFVALSFYKIFGAPTGLGALLVRDDAAKLLRKVYWGGGTVDAASADENVKELKQRPCELLEDGTLNFLGVTSLEPALDWMERHGGHEALGKHAHAVFCDALSRLSSLRHKNGARVVRIYSHAGEMGTCQPSQQAPVIAFNVLDPSGWMRDPGEVERLARGERGIHMRAGVHCNPGGAAAYCLNADVAEEVALGLCGEEALPEYARANGSNLESSPHARFSGAVGCGCQGGGEGSWLPWADDDSGIREKFGQGAVGSADPSDGLKGWVHDVEQRTAERVPHVEALRASFGYLSTLEDSRALAVFIWDYFAQQ